jgi:hypothetical protein
MLDHGLAAWSKLVSHTITLDLQHRDEPALIEYPSRMVGVLETRGQSLFKAPILRPLRGPFFKDVEAGL